jgi:adenylate kinase
LRLNILILGPQGSGKGTQAKRISAEYGVPHVASGEMFRAAIAKRTPLGQEVEPILAAGALVPDELTIGLIRERLGEEDARPGFVLDGFPRNMAQAEALDSLLDEIERPLSVVLEFQIADEICIERLLRRAQHEARPDDTPEVIAKRLEIYHEETKPLVHHYLATGRVVGIHAGGSVNEVWKEIQEALEQTLDRPARERGRAEEAWGSGKAPRAEGDAP